jgi:ubiquitin-conjugating enzyme E2 Z
MPFESHGNQMQGKFDYILLEKRLNAIYLSLHDETAQWLVDSKTAHEDRSSQGFNLRAQFEQIKFSQEFSSHAHVALDENNPFFWTITIFGQHGTDYEYERV